MKEIHICCHIRTQRECLKVHYKKDRFHNDCRSRMSQ
jgi:hypothetical protein